MAVSTPPKAPEPFQITKRDLETVRYQNEPMRQASWTFPAVMLPGEDWPRVRQFALDTVMQMKQLYPEKFVGKTQQDWENALTGFIATRRPDFRAQVLGQLKSRYGEGKPMDPDLVLTKAIEGFGKQASGLTLKKLVEESKKDPWYGLGTAEKSKEVFPLHHEGRLVGYLRTGKSLMGDKTTGFIYVTPSERNKGIGTKAMLDVAQRYPGLLSFVHEKNLPSLRIHEKAGYEFTQKRGRGSPETMIWKHLEKKAEEGALFHGSPKKLNVLVPKDLHGDPGVGNVVFAAPTRAFALPYAGAKWGDRDVDQSAKYKDGVRRITLRETRPGAFKDIFEGKKGYLYEVPKAPFKPATKKTTWEVVSEKKVKPLKVEEIKDVGAALRSSGVEMLPYDPKETTKVLLRRDKRAAMMTPENRRLYYKWWLKKAPKEIRSLIEERLEKKAEKVGFFHSAPPGDPIRAWLDKVKNEAKSQGYNLFAVAEYKKGPGASVTLAHGSGGDSAVKNARNAQEQWERQKDAGLLKKGVSEIFMDEIAKISGGVVAKGQEAGTVPAMGTDRKFNTSRRLGFVPPMPRKL